MQGRGGGRAEGALRGRAGLPAAVYIVPLFFLLNSSLNMLNRWALGHAGFAFPLLLTCCHAAFGFLAMAPLVLLLGRWQPYMDTLQRQWRGILVVGLCLAANIAFNNLSLVYISLSLNQVIRASIPVVTAAVGAALDQRLPHRREMSALLVLCGGVALVVAEAKAQGNTLGVAICMCSVLAGASMLVASSRVLSEKLDVIQLAFFTAPVTCLALLPLVVAREAAGLQRYLATAGTHSTAALIILAGSLIAALYNVVHYAMVHTTSPVTTCVFGQAKIVGLLLLSAAFLGETKEFTLRMSAGCCLALVGLGAYSWLKLGQQQQQGTPKGARGSPKLAGRGTPTFAGRGTPTAADFEAQAASDPSLVLQYAAKSPSAKAAHILASSGSWAVLHQDKAG